MNTEHTAERSDNEHHPIKDISQDGILHVYLNEYRKPKDEQIARIVMREHLVYVTLGVFGGVSSYALHEGQHYAFLNRLPLWETPGVFVRYLPAYGSALNLIEILWRVIQYHWLSVDAYLSFDNLVSSVEQILAPLGKTFRINLAS